MERLIASRPIQGFILSILVLTLAACGGDQSAPTSQASPTPAPPVATFTIAEAAPQGRLLNIDKLKITPASGLTIKSETRYGTKFANDPKYLKMFGSPHEDMLQQTVVANGVEGSVTFVYFTGRDQAVLAFNTVKGSQGERPWQALIFGNTVVVIQMSSLDETKLGPFTGKIRDAIVVNANS